MKKITLVLAGILLSASAFSQTWAIDKAHSRIGFGVNHLGINEINGDFLSFDSKITASKSDFSDAVIEFSADINSINTDMETRDKHLKTPDFFDAANYPTLTFKSTSFKKVNGKKYKVTGNLTMHGITKAVTLDAELVGTTVHPQSQKEMAGFKITGMIKRSAFGIAPAMPTAMLGEDVELIANTEFSKG